MRALLIAALVLSGAAPAGAAPEGAKPKPKQGISAVLDTLDWGVSTVKVLEVLSAEVEDRYGKLLEKADTLQIDRLLREQRAEIKTIKGSLVRFDGQRTGYEASLISDDFRANSGEAVIRVDDGPAQRYYFFRDEQLWKVLVVYSSNITRRLKFPGFVGQVSKKYGPPKARITDPEDKSTLVQATWHDELTRLDVQDRALYGTYVMRFLAKPMGVEIEDNRVGQADGTAPVVDAAAESMISDIMADGGGAKADVVDRITGRTHQVDLELGREDLQPLRRAPPPKARSPRTDKGAPAPKKAPEPPPVDGTGGDVIIY